MFWLYLKLSLWIKNVHNEKVYILWIFNIHMKKRNYSLRIYVDEEERGKIEDLAHAQSLSVSSLLRSMVLRSLNKGVSREDGR